MAGDGVLRVQLSKQFNAATQETGFVVIVEFHPVHGVRIATAGSPRANVLPIAHAVSAPGLTQGLERPILLLEPLAELLLGSLAMTLTVVQFVPEVVSEQGGVVTVPLDQRALKPFCGAKNVFIVQANTDAPNGGTGGYGGAPGLESLGHPFGSEAGQLSDDDLDAVTGGKIHLPVVVCPIIHARLDLNR